MICIMLNLPQSIVLTKLLTEVLTLYDYVLRIRISHSESGALLLQISFCQPRESPDPRSFPENGAVCGVLSVCVYREACPLESGHVCRKHTKLYVEFLTWVFYQINHFCWEIQVVGLSLKFVCKKNINAKLYMWMTHIGSNFRGHECFGVNFRFVIWKSWCAWHLG